MKAFFSGIWDFKEQKSQTLLKHKRNYLNPNVFQQPAKAHGTSSRLIVPTHS